MPSIVNATDQSLTIYHPDGSGAAVIEPGDPLEVDDELVDSYVVSGMWSVPKPPKKSDPPVADPTPKEG